MRKALIAFGMMVSVAVTGPAWGHGSADNPAKKRPAQAVEEKPFGRPGDPKKATRTIHIEMRDEMEYLPNGLRLRAGDTVKFVVRNSGRLMHELVLGTMEEIEAHAALMRKHPGMEHDEPHMVHVAPGRTQTLVWQFTRPGVFYYACLLPGHFEAGMVGIVRVLATAATR
jgi:uncharacterized cupredoxin-like copper-binding protein